MPSRYYVWRERAIETILREWRKLNAVCRITVVQSNDYRSPVTEEILRVTLQNLEIEGVIRSFQDQDTNTFLQDLCRAETHGIIFSTAGLASMFAFRSPDKLTDLLRAQRVALLDGPIDLPFAKVPDAPVDLVTVNWQEVAESIVNDLITRDAFERNRFTTFEAEARLRVPLSNFSQELRPARGMAASA